MPLFTQYICPYCLKLIRSWKEPTKCPDCSESLPVQYVTGFESHPPFFTQVFGWSGVGKTVFLSALTLMLVKMTKIWQSYNFSATTNISQEKVREINEFLARGSMPRPTQSGPQDVYIMILEGMERWGSRALVTRDCAGEIFDDMEVPVIQAPYLLNAPTTFMLISLPDLQGDGRSMDMLMNNYINTLMKHKVNFNKEQRNLVVVFTKADIIQDLPTNLRNYLISDPLWAAINSPTEAEQMNATAMQEYIEVMSRVNTAIKDWIQRDASGKNFVRLAERKNINIRFSLISSTGAPVEEENAMPVALSPRRVLDPYFWALELQSR